MSRLLLLPVACGIAASAHASYAQMRLDGLGLALAFVLTIAYGLVVDLALFVRLFRYRPVVLAGIAVSLVAALLLLGGVAAPAERAGFFKMASGGAGPLLLAVIGAVFVPFIFVAPLAQYRSMREGRRWPRWITAWMAVQLALVPAFIVLAFTDHYFWQRELADAQARGNRVEAGGLGALLDFADRRKERIWGTGWTYPWPHDAMTGSAGWSLGLSLGLEASALVASAEPLGAADRAALETLSKRHLLFFAGPRVRTKLLWDALEAGRFSRLLAPRGVDEVGAAGEEVIPILLERLEQHGGDRLCPGGRMAEADRAVLKALVEARGRVWNVATRDYGVRPQWEGFPQRVERLCAGGVIAGKEMRT